jgi:hypothetical protein
MILLESFRRRFFKGWITSVLTGSQNCHPTSLAFGNEFVIYTPSRARDLGNAMDA